MKGMNDNVDGNDFNIKRRASVRELKQKEKRQIAHNVCADIFFSKITVKIIISSHYNKSLLLSSIITI